MPTIAIHGAAGRMGRRLVALTTEDSALTLAAAIERVDHELLGQDAGIIAGARSANVPLKDGLSQKVDVLIDFSTPPATRRAMGACVETGSAMVMGTTGLQEQDHAAIDVAARTIAVLQAPNMSVGVNVLFAIAGQVAAQLGDEYDIEITEAHHRFKVDAPSGTALGIAESICQATGKRMQHDVVYDRHGPDVPRRSGQIGMHALRLGDLAGRHTVSFGALGEELQFTHIASTRDVFARGALAAAKWLAGKPAGRYHMADVLGLAGR
jgi:4-hydroxy-tetrahydrodipicolinate reductase